MNVPSLSTTANRSASGSRPTPMAAFDFFNRASNSPICSLRSEEHTSELQSQSNLVCRLLLEKKKIITVMPLYLQRRFGLNEDTIRQICFVFSALGAVMRAWPVGWSNASLDAVRRMRLSAVLH